MVKKKIVGCVYRAPNCDSTYFIESFDLRLQELNRNSVDAYLIGRFQSKLAELW